MNNADIIVVGAGAAGLIAARDLANAGKKVIVLEAQDRMGGRIHTLYNDAGLQHVELGAEFVHGDLPVTLSLLNEAGIVYQSASAAMWRYKQGKFTRNEQFMEHWNLLSDKLNALQQDVPIDYFLQKEFADDKYKSMREGVRQFVSGYDTADPEKASCFALRNEWEQEDESAQHRINGGYMMLINYLANECKDGGGEVHLNAVVKDIYWEPGKVSIITVDGSVYHAVRIILAVPLGILQAAAKGQDVLTFHPPVKIHQEAILHMGFGAVIKLLLEFDTAFWEDEQVTGVKLNELGYLFSEEEIPTWWTQYPQHTTLLTGWLGGPPARDRKDLSDEEILQQGLQSIASIFNFNVDDLRVKLKAWHVLNWTAKPFIRGSYAYDTVQAPEARKIINTPVDNTVFFAGEYLYEGAAMGTVEAALTSGRHVAEVIINQGFQ